MMNGVQVEVGATSGEKLMVGIPLMRRTHGPGRHLVLDDTPNLPKLVARRAAFAPRELAVSIYRGRSSAATC